jgi:hypothetical protein
VRLHDFRRTLSSHLYRATKDDYLVKRCINHVNTSITAIYVRIPYEDVAKALQAQAERFYAVKEGAVCMTTTAVYPAVAMGTTKPLERPVIVAVDGA